MSVFYRKYQNKNRQSVAYGKWFARAVTIGKTINIDELAKHMSEHNTPYSKGAIKGVLTDMIGCIRELMLEGKAVKLEGLAIFSAGIKTKKNGAPTSADFSTTKHIDSVYMRARATGEFTRSELTKAGNVTELPKNYTDYTEEPEDNGGSQNSGSENGSANSGSGSGSVSETVAPPTISGNTAFTESTQVTMTAASGAEIRYTTNGTQPTAESTLYSGPLTLTETTVMKAISIKNGVTSSVNTKTFTKYSGGGGGSESGDME